MHKTRSFKGKVYYVNNIFSMFCLRMIPFISKSFLHRNSTRNFKYVLRATKFTSLRRHMVSIYFTLHYSQTEFYYSSTYYEKIHIMKTRLREIRNEVKTKRSIYWNVEIWNNKNKHITSLIEYGPFLKCLWSLLYMFYQPYQGLFIIQGVLLF